VSGVSEFLLVGTWAAAPAEVPLGAAAHDVVTRAAWHAWLRRWGLLRSFGLAADPGAGPRACLVVRATGDEAARRLAAAWERVSGYRVTVLPLTGAAAGEGWGR
jgi:hypothetical protein